MASSTGFGNEPDPDDAAALLAIIEPDSGKYQ
jgi:hypothetical protein